MNPNWGWLTRSEIKNRCYACGRTDNLQEQLCGFWFCFWHIDEAKEVGASFWMRLNKGLFPGGLE